MERFVLWIFCKLIVWKMARQAQVNPCDDDRSEKNTGQVDRSKTIISRCL